MPLTTVQLGMQGTPQFYGFKNRIINGAMVIDQRNAGASVTPTASAYTLDRWRAVLDVTSKFSVQQNAGAVTPPTGFKNYLGVTSLSAYTVGTNESFYLQQPIEGFNTSDLDFGTANAKTVTLSFLVRSSLTGTFGGSIWNSAVNRLYPFTYTISVANTWEQKSVTIAGDTSGTWIGATNGVGLFLNILLGAGSGVSGTANAWGTGTSYFPTGATSVVGTNGATFYLTGVQLEVGSTATSFDYRPYGTELALCQRYFEVHVCGGNNTGIMPMSTGSSTSGRGTYVFKVQKRANPSSVAFLAANQYLYQGAGLNAAPSGIAIAVASPSALLIDVTISGATTNATANLLENSTAGANMISISAEL